MNTPAVSQLDWQEGQPISRQFGDVYFSRNSGIEETRYVFLQSNYLAERFAKLTNGEFFAVGETGFGTGLNFLCSWQLFEQVAPKHAYLHFVSFEQFPLSVNEMTQVLGLWPELAQWRDLFLQQYQVLSSGWHRFVFAQGRIYLTLIIGDANQTLPQTVGQFDAWFLDGFAPAKNPQLWSTQVFQEVARLTKPDATFATYTSAGEVKRQLIVAGFEVEKTRGYANKREMLRGRRREKIDSFSATTPYIAQELWRQTVVTQKMKPTINSPPKTALVIGAGLAGASIAHALAQRNWQVTVCERHAQIAAEASGNPLGILYPRLTEKNTPVAQLIRQGYQHSLRLLKTTDKSKTGWHACGLLQLAFNAAEVQRIALLQQSEELIALGHIVDAQQASQLAGIELACNGLWLPQAGWIEPAQWCRHWLAHKNITFQCHYELDQFQNLPEGGWQIVSKQGVIQEAQILILCTASQTRLFAPTAYLPITPLRGQISQVLATPASRLLRTIVCTEGYIAPVWHDKHIMGASFNRQRLDSEPSIEEHQQNIRMLQNMAPALYSSLQENLNPKNMQGRATLRAMSPDYLPMVGAVRQAGPRRNALLKGKLHIPQLFVSVGHGARGLISAPLMAEVLASQINGEPMPVNAGNMLAVQPTRFHNSG